jgi:hypothetical protein
MHQYELNSLKHLISFHAIGNRAYVDDVVSPHFKNNLS